MNGKAEGSRLKAEVPTVRVRRAFTVEHPQQGAIEFFNVLEPGHSLGFQSSLCRETIEERGYQLEVIP